MPAPSETTTTVEAVHKRYGRRGAWVLRGVDLELAPGTVTEVIGPNGSGKSTLLRIVAGLTRPTRGRVRPAAGPVAYAPDRLPARLRMSARAYVRHMGRLRGLDGAPGEALLERLGLSPGPDAPIATLSKGNSQKVALAQAFAAPVAVLLLDEPASGLDPEARRVLGQLLDERRAQGTGVLVTGHVPFDAVRADASLVLQAGVLERAPAPVPRVRIELAAGGDRRVLDVERGESDGVLARALAEGWSVVSVTPQ